MRALYKTRTGIEDFNSVPGARYVSLDFNDDGLPSKETTGIEIAVPDDLDSFETGMCIEYCEAVQLFFKMQGIDREIRRTNGLAYNRGIAGVIHTEPFFQEDYSCTRAIMNNPRTYAYILASTLGHIDGVTFLLPHKYGDGGAQNSRGMNEREFARYYIIPYLEEMVPEGPQVDFTETRLA